MLWDPLGAYLKLCRLLNSCFSRRQCKHTQTAKLATKLAAEQNETCTVKRSFKAHRQLVQSMMHAPDSAAETSSAGVGR